MDKYTKIFKFVIVNKFWVGYFSAWLLKNTHLV